MNGKDCPVALLLFKKVLTREISKSFMKKTDHVYWGQGVWI